MHLVLDQLICSLKKLSSEDNDRSSSISYLSILDLGKFHEDFGGWMNNLKLFENCGAIIGDGNIADIIDKHLVKTLWAKTALHNVC